MTKARDTAEVEDTKLDKAGDTMTGQLTMDDVAINATTTMSFETDDIERLRINSDGSLSASTVDYETLVTADDDIPNKKYVDDAVGGVGGGAWELLSSVSASGASSVDMNITDINAGALADDYISLMVVGLGNATGDPNFTFRLKESGSVVNSTNAYYLAVGGGESYMQIYDLDINWVFSFQVLGTQSGKRASVIAGEYESYRTTGGGTVKDERTSGSYIVSTRMSTNATDGINFTVSSGTINGEIRMYGVKNA